MASFTESKYPQLAEQIKELAKRHMKFKDEPMLLAMAFSPRRRDKDIHLFEVLENFGFGDINPHKELFEITFGSSDDFPLEKGQVFHLVLTNPGECRVAFKDNWKLARAIKKAIKNNQYEVLHSDRAGQRLLRTIKQ